MVIAGGDEVAVLVTRIYTYNIKYYNKYLDMYYNTYQMQQGRCAGYPCLSFTPRMLEHFDCIAGREGNIRHFNGLYTGRHRSFLYRPWPAGNRHYYYQAM